MQASGYQKILKLIKAPNAVPHMLSGKAYSRAIRAHVIVDWVLNTLLVAEMCKVGLRVDFD